MFSDKYKKYKKAFVFGTGGGNDILSAIIPALRLNKLGVKTDIGGVLSPAAFHTFDGKNEQVINEVYNVKRYIKTLSGDKFIDLIDNYLPEATKKLGLDYKFSTERVIGKSRSEDIEELKKIQKECFEKIISLSEKMNIPMIIHSRKAESDIVDMLESSKAKKIVMHCFSGKKRLVNRICDNGWTFSVPLLVTK